MVTFDQMMLNLLTSIFFLMENNLRLLIATGKGLVIVDHVCKHDKSWNEMHCECLEKKHIIKKATKISKQVGFFQKRNPIRGVQYLPIPIAMNIK